VLRSRSLTRSRPPSTSGPRHEAGAERQHGDEEVRRRPAVGEQTTGPVAGATLSARLDERPTWAIGQKARRHPAGRDLGRQRHPEEKTATASAHPGRAVRSVGRHRRATSDVRRRVDDRRPASPATSTASTRLVRALRRRRDWRLQLRDRELRPGRRAGASGRDRARARVVSILRAEQQDSRATCSGELESPRHANLDFVAHSRPRPAAGRAAQTQLVGSSSAPARSRRQSLPTRRGAKGVTGSGSGEADRTPSTRPRKPDRRRRRRRESSIVTILAPDEDQEMPCPRVADSAGANRSRGDGTPGGAGRLPPVTRCGRQSTTHRVDARGVAVRLLGAGRPGRRAARLARARRCGTGVRRPYTEIGAEGRDCRGGAEKVRTSRGSSAGTGLLADHHQRPHFCDTDAFTARFSRGVPRPARPSPAWQLVDRP
jgi:hypothetical protein